MPLVTIYKPDSEEANVIEVKEGENLARTLVEQGVSIQHKCQFNGACSSCAIKILEGGESLNSPDDDELDQLDYAGLGEEVRLSCQVKMGNENIVIKLRN